ncbi:hypothetical protein BD410DRAFT_776494 [Rickenella mellea]|uniref:DNA-directed RNA polymerase III subunit RPC6 n=1 Tax=Rickenella mellea TaxID=50990 RepID=A0A4Y7PPM5_9AGAM|nr:hypothetical protein BD410DRAFT_776494 [Rickenella mellea]
MAVRSPSALENKLLEVALISPSQEITAKEWETVIPDHDIRVNALNYLLSVGRLKASQTEFGRVSFRAVTEDERRLMAGMNTDEAMVFTYIKASGAEGIWTKHLKSKTNIHQTVIDHCLKILVQKRLVKRVPSVQHRTRKIYMLYEIEPSSSLTGGPWYTGNDLDTEYIKVLIDASLRYIRSKTFPKARLLQKQPLFLISNSPLYPSARDIQNFLKESKISMTELSTLHVETLLNVLVVDGLIEKIPIFRSAQCEPIHETHADVDERPSNETQSDCDLEVAFKVNDSPPGLPLVTGKRKLESDQPESERQQKRLKPFERNGWSDDGKLSVRILSLQTTAVSTRRALLDDPDRTFSDIPQSAYQGRLENEDTMESQLHAYRAVRQETVLHGLSSATCTRCPSFKFCADNGPVNAHTCAYFTDWLAPSNGSGT